MGIKDSARDTLIQTIENLIKAPPTKEEVDRARNQLLKQIELNLNSSDQVGVELSEWMAMGDWRQLFVRRRRLQNVTVEDVTRVAAAYLKPSNRVAEVLREPAFPQTEFDQLKQEELTKLEQQRSDPIMLNFNASMRHVLPYPKGHPRYLPTFDEAIAELKTVRVTKSGSFTQIFSAHRAVSWPL